MPRMKRKCNGEGDDAAAAARLSEQFHGRPARTVRDVDETYYEPFELADLGKLIELTVRLANGRKTALGSNSNIRVAATPDGKSLYFVGGDQAIDLTELGIDSQGKDHVLVGTAQRIVYLTSKAFHSFEPTEYFHTFGEEGGELPTLAYDVRSQKLYLIGGSYVVMPEGITD